MPPCQASSTPQHDAEPCCQNHPVYQYQLNTEMFKFIIAIFHAHWKINNKKLYGGMSLAEDIRFV
jgi:hypothetical protein